jgi:hypothetical protein
MDLLIARMGTPFSMLLTPRPRDSPDGLKSRTVIIGPNMTND